MSNQGQEKKENKMGVMPVNKLIWNMSIPMMISMLVQALYNVVDSIFVAKLSEDALTAVSLAFPLQMMLISVSVGTGVGINALLSKSLGERDFKKVNDTATNGGFIYLLSYLVFLVVGLTCVKPFYNSMLKGQNPQIMEYGCTYLSIVLIVSFGLFTQVFFERLLTSTGKTVFSMISQLSGAVINLILDPIMIFGLLGCPKMGIAGAAVATVTGQIIAGIIALTCHVCVNKEVKISLKGFKPNGAIIKGIYSVGVPAIIMQSIGSVMNFCMNQILIGFTPTATAVFGVYFNLQSFFFMPIFGMTNGITPILAFSYGAGQRKRMMKTIKISMIAAFLLAGFGCLCFEFIPHVLLRLFDAQEEMMAIGTVALRVIGIHYLFAWFCIIIGTVFQALGKAMYSMIVSIMRQLFVLIPAAYILAKVGGLSAVWWSFPIAELMSLMVTLFFFARIYKNIIKQIPEGND